MATVSNMSLSVGAAGLTTLTFNFSTALGQGSASHVLTTTELANLLSVFFNGKPDGPGGFVPTTGVLTLQCGNQDPRGAGGATATIQIW